MTEEAVTMTKDEMIRAQKAEDERLHRKVQELEAAICAHRASVWGDGDIEHPADKRLYEALGDE